MMAGADLFETDFPLQLAQQGLVLQLKTKGYEQSIDYVTQLKAASKSIDTVADSALSLALISEKLNEQTLQVDLTVCQRDYRWGEGPLLEGCECYCCRNYSRSYLYHLYEVQEMNANILTALHNMKVYDDLF